MVAVGRAPGVENTSHSGEHAFEVGGLLLQKRPDMDARGRPRPPERNDVSDLSECQPEPPRLHYERQQFQHVSGVPTVARGCPAGWRKDATCLVEPKRLAAQSAARRDLTDEQPMLHEAKIEPAPRGKVKWHDAGAN